MASVISGVDMGVGMGGGRPLPQETENFTSIWGTLVKYRGSFMQKETTIKEKNCTCVGILLPSPHIGIIYHIILFLNMNANENVHCI